VKVWSRVRREKNVFHNLPMNGIDRYPVKILKFITYIEIKMTSMKEYFSEDGIKLERVKGTSTIWDPVTGIRYIRPNTSKPFKPVKKDVMAYQAKGTAKPIAAEQPATRQAILETLAADIQALVMKAAAELARNDRAFIESLLQGR
jgi:hypothetical protein